MGGEKASLEIKYYEISNNLYTRIEIEQIVNRKTVKIVVDSNVSLDSVYNLLMEILRFENLYEGIFFMFTSFKVDGAEFCSWLVEPKKEVVIWQKIRCFPANQRMLSTK